MSGKVLLICMPFGTLHIPPLGVSLLKPALRERGVECEVRHFNLDFCARYFPHNPEKVRRYQDALQAPRGLFFVGEWLFARHLFPSVADKDCVREFEDHNVGSARLASEQADVLHWALKLRDEIPRFIDHCLRAVRWDDFAIVGFSSCYNQNLASMALASEIKRRNPQIITVIGGANADGQMGSGILKACPQIDYVFKGEADRTFPIFAEHVTSGRDIPELPGLVRRDRLTAPPPPVIQDLDHLPIPDFNDFYEQARALGLDQVVGRTLSVETSRGCWWGERSHCTFCGLNAEGMAFRSKSPGRVLEELQYLADHYNSKDFVTTDNILDLKYFKTLLPELIRRNLKLKLFYETKSNLTPGQFDLMRQAGIREIQPGIESLSTHILRLMKKGTTLLRNVECLKQCRACGIAPVWLHLFGFPGETLEDYEEIARILPAIHHLCPPNGLNSVVVQRFSPFFNTPSAFGIADIRPFASYHDIYPFADNVVNELAYHFESGYAEQRNPRIDEYIKGVLAKGIEQWRYRYYLCNAVLSALDLGSRMLILDTRTDRKTAWFVGCLETCILRAAERPRGVASIFEDVRKSLVLDDQSRHEVLDAVLGSLFGPDGDAYLQACAIETAEQSGAFVQRLEVARVDALHPSEQECTEALAGLVRSGLILQESGSCLSLVIPHTEDEESPEVLASITGVAKEYA